MDFVIPLCPATKKTKRVRMLLLRKNTLIFHTENYRMNAFSMCPVTVDYEFVLCCLWLYILLPFLKWAQANPAADPGQSQVLCLLLSHWVGQWIKLLYVSTAALCLLVLSLHRRKTESLLLRSVVHMLASSYFPRTRQYRGLTENEFSGNLSLLVSSSSLQPVENYLLWMLCSCCFSACSRNCCFHVSVHVIFIITLPPSRHHWTTAVRCPSQSLGLSLVARGISSSLRTKMESSPRLLRLVVQD